MTSIRETVRGVGALLALAALVGCDSALSVNDQPLVGAVSLRAVPASGRGAVISGDAFFLSGSTLSVPDPGLVPDSCVVQAIDSTNTFNRGNVAAGASIGLRVNTTDGSMGLSSSESRYVIASGTRLEYQFGDSVRITIPGQAGGFPPSTSFARLAEPLTVAPLVIPAVGQPAALRWSPAGTQQSGIVATLRFRTAPGQAGRQALCSVRDDGVFDIPARVVDSLRTAGSPDQISVTRFRTGQIEVSRRASLYVLSAFENVTSLAPR